MSATVTITEAAEILGCSRNTAYEAVRRDGELAGVPVIKLGERRLVIPRAPLLAVLGLSASEVEEEV